MIQRDPNAPEKPIRNPAMGPPSMGPPTSRGAPDLRADRMSGQFLSSEEPRMYDDPAVSSTGICLSELEVL